VMRVRASTAGNIVGKGVPVSSTEVSQPPTSSNSSPIRTAFQDDNQVLRTWHPDGPNGTFEKKPGILAHHEVLLRLDAMDLDRGNLSFISFLSTRGSTNHVQAQKSLDIVAISLQTTVLTSIRPSSHMASTFCATKVIRRSSLHSS
jgi:hypothetical protein